MSSAVNRTNGEFAHHYDSAAHEFETSKFGVWLFKSNIFWRNPLISC